MNKNTILVVDDEPNIRETAAFILQMEGFEVVKACNGEEGLEAIHKYSPKMILLDVMMPELSGWKTFDKIKENDMWRNIPIIFLTARTDRVAKHAGGFLAEDYIEKPAKIQELKERIDKILNNK